MSTALVKKDRLQGARALERLSSGLSAVDNKTALIRSLLPSLPRLHLPVRKPPPNIVRVVLGGADEYFYPGDLVGGLVRLLVSEPMNVQEVSVILTGVTEAKATRAAGQSLKAVYRSKIEIVRSTCEINLETSVLRPQRYEWPFQIRVPRTCEISELPFDEATRRFNDSLIQALPPTFADTNLQDVRSKCRIAYSVSAKAVLKHPHEDVIRHEVPLKILASDTRSITATSADEYVTQRCTFKFRSLGPSSPASNSLKPQDNLERKDRASTAPDLHGKSGPPALMAKIRISLMPFTLPSYSFDLDAILPRSGRLSEPLPIALRLSWHTLNLPHDQSQDHRPLVSLKSAVINLVSRTLMRAMPEDTSVGAGFVLATGSLHQVWRSKPVVIAELKEQIDSLPESLDLSRVILLRVGKFQPAFRTFNIAREYVLQVLCRLESCNETFEARYEVEQFAVIAEDGISDDFEDQRLLNSNQMDVLEAQDNDTHSENSGIKIGVQEEPMSGSARHAT